MGPAAGRPGGCRFGVHPILPAACEPWMTTPDGATGAPRTGPEVARGKRPGWGAPGWGAALALAGAIFASLLALAGRTTLWDRDEPRFAQATVEMIASGHYLVPTFNRRLRPDQPVLASSWMALPL